MRLILFRHGETEHNRGQFALGRADVPLNARGLRQARSVAASFMRAPAAIYSSPLGRCFEMAEMIAGATGADVAVEPALIEMDVGEMEHLGRDELGARYPEFLREWMSAPADARMPGGETLRGVQVRAWGAVELMAERAGGEDEVVAVTHNFVILALACRALGLPLDSFRRLRTSLAGKTVIDLGPGDPALISWNDTSHLRSAGLS